MFQLFTTPIDRKVFCSDKRYRKEVCEKSWNMLAHFAKKLVNKGLWRLPCAGAVLAQCWRIRRSAGARAIAAATSTAWGHLHRLGPPPPPGATSTAGHG
jgi:hypothetical protein